MTTIRTSSGPTPVADRIPAPSPAWRESGPLPGFRPAIQVGAWELTEPIGSGSFSEVWAARPAETSRQHPADYALKLVRPEFRSDVGVLRTLDREWRIGREVSHPHLVPILDGQFEPHGNSFLVMPRLRGALVRTSIDRIGRFVIPQALWIARQVVEALMALHAHGWLHGDIKPENVHVTADGHATLLDLGLAIPLSGRLGGREHEGGGSLAYVAPERLVMRQPLTGQCDIYSLGVTLYEMLVGSHPYPHVTSGQCVQAHLSQSVVPPHVRHADIPLAVSELVCDMLRKEPLRRPYPCGQLRERLLVLEAETFAQRGPTDSDDAEECELWPEDTAAQRWPSPHHTGVAEGSLR